MGSVWGEEMKKIGRQGGQPPAAPAASPRRRRRQRGVGELADWISRFGFCHHHLTHYSTFRLGWLFTDMVEDRYIGLALAFASSFAIGASIIITKKVRCVHRTSPPRVPG
jgi:hypothetical protein